MSSSSDSGARPDLVGLVLAAGAGTGLRPLTYERPKPLCPVGDQVLVDRALARLDEVVEVRVVNLCHGAEMIRAHLGARVVGEITAAGDVAGEVSQPAPTNSAPVLVSDEPEALGTAGAIGRLAPWLDGRAVLVLNADTVTDAPLAALLDGWDGQTTRLAVHGADRFSARALIAGALLGPDDVVLCPDSPSGLYEVLWRRRHEQGRLEVVRVDGHFVDCGTPASYLAANLAETPGGGESVVGRGAEVRGSITSCVIWPGARVEAGESLDRAIRTTAGRTVLVR